MYKVGQDNFTVKVNDRSYFVFGITFTIEMIDVRKRLQ